MRLGTRSITALTLTAGLCAAGYSQAAVIQVATTGSVTEDRNLTPTAPSGNTTLTVLSLGETTTDVAVARPYIPFVLTASDKSDILTPGATASLGITVSFVPSALTGYTYNLVGIGGKTSPTPVTADYAGGTAILSGIVPTNGRINFDVTAFVAAQALTTPGVSAFRLELVGPTLPNSDGVQNILLVNSTDNTTSGGATRPMLTITAVPEPTSLAGLGLMSAALLRRRRNAEAK